MVFGGENKMKIKSGWDDSLEIDRGKTPPHVATSNFKKITAKQGEDKKVVTLKQLQKLDQYCIAGEYLCAYSAASKKRKQR